MNKKVSISTIVILGTILCLSGFSITTLASEDESTHKVSNLDGNKEKTAVEDFEGIAYGEIGTSKWEIDKSGVLHIGSGEFSSLEGSTESPFFVYADQINSIVFEGPVVAGESLQNLFLRLVNVTNIENLQYLNTSNVTNMAGMFAQMSKLEELDLSLFNTSQVTNMGTMFAKLWSLRSLDVSSFDTSQVTNMSAMFFDMKNLDALNLSNFNTSKVTNMFRMFTGAEKLKMLNISSFDTSSVSNMAQMFQGLPIDVLDLSHFETENVTNMAGMFLSMPNLISLDISNFDTKKVTNMNLMFSKETNQLKHLKIGNNFKFQNISQLTDASTVFPYTGKWQKNHEGETYTALELMDQYVGETMSGDWYWEEKNSTVKETIDAKDSTITVGDIWNPKDNFISAKDNLGSDIPFVESMVSGTVDTNKVGKYKVIYTNGAAVKEITVTVESKDPESVLEIINAKNSTITVGDTWNPKDNFVNAKDSLGNKVPFNSNMVSGSVNTSKVGVYKVVYNYGRAKTEVYITVQEKNKESNNSTSVSKESTNLKEKDKNKKLPQTSETKDSLAVVTGTISLLLGSGVVLIRKK